MVESSQVSLFDNATPNLGERSTSEITFKGKLTEPIHRWYRLTASFSPQLATDVLAHFDLNPTARVLDPFCGVGTVLLCAQRLGVSATGVEVNPLLAQVASTKVNLNFELAEIKQEIQEYIDALSKDVLNHSDLGLESIPELDWPPIYNAKRWWQEAPMKVLLLAEKRRRDNLTGYGAELVATGLAGVLVELSDAGAGRVSLSFLNDPPSISEADALAKITTQLQNMLEDLESWSPVREQLPDEYTCRVIHGDSRDLFQALDDAPRFDLLLTSPPYPNRFSYVRETRPHLYFFELLKEREAAGKLDLETVGGTWGRATSTLDSDLFTAAKPVGDALGHVLPQLRDANRKMANYVVRYFNDMWEHLQNLDETMASRSRVIYVVGNTKIAGFEIRTDEIISELLREAGFGTDSIERMRKRQSRKGLYEATVFASRGKNEQLNTT